ncbi:Exoenzymes regulatory protein AepA in lipid-linked oligosaccharide synthesis cluster [Photobacterium marinum]|uniref:Exoenzymes regulatory protein AepA in lipid-linked oligosaccharide synthesis cluster n=2 Tax=Photobacterium marinum TaxID=1056511 RepID=L8J7V3_9GAMM|nr:Exoenzymes regulatory protein AepA in lipid-linked oligosaccharide synthesis cluster [Photobacterium marinum]
MSAQQPQAAEYADTIITNALVYADKEADAIAISDGKIIFVGDSRRAGEYRTSTTEVIDMEGAMVLPGFVDNHNHVFEAASEVGGNCELNGDATLEEQISYLKQCRKQAKANEWVMGYGFTIDSVLDEDSERTPLEVLDEIFPDQPVVLMEQTSHSMWVNSKALKLAGINKDSPEPQGGKILKDRETGHLNGILFDNAGDLVMDLAWNSLKGKFDQSYDGLMIGLEEAAAHGITTIGDGRMYWKRGWYEVWKEAQKNGELTARVSLRPWIYPQDGQVSQLKYLKSIQSRDPESRLIVDQVKMYSDGILINGTAKTLAPYLSTYIEDEPYGINYIPPSEMKSWLTELDKIGYGAHIHAIGDGGIRESLNAVEYARRQGSDRDYTLTHVEMVNSKDISRFKLLDVTADFQVGSDYIAQHDHSWAEPFIGAKRARSLMQISRIYQAGANVSLSSDWNVHDINPLVGIANSLKMGNTGLPGVEVAIDAYTINPAVSLGLDDIIGSIEVGKSADLVVLDKDITKLKPEAIAKTNILMTMLQGEVVFDADD